MESLETRTLFTGITGVTPANFDPGNVYPITGAFDNGGHFWYANQQTNSLDEIDNSGNLLASVQLQTQPGNSAPLPEHMVLAPNGHIFFFDDNYIDASANNVGAIDDFDPASGAIVVHGMPLASDPDLQGAHRPPPNGDLTVTSDGAVWFANSISTSTGFTSSIARLDASGQLSILDINDTQDAAFHIAASGDSVVLTFANTNRVGTATFSSADGIQLTNTFAVNSGSAVSDAGDLIQNIVAAPDGSVWFALTNTGNGDGDYIVHGVINGSSLDQTGYLVPGSDANLAGTIGLAMDGAGHLFFSQIFSNSVGYLDTQNLGSSDRFTIYNYATDLAGENPDNPTSFPGSIAVSSDPAATSAFALNQSGFPLVRIDVPASQVTFSGQAFPVMGTENVAITTIPLATFTGVSGQTYTATIAWGNNTTSTVTATDMGDNTFAIVVPSKTFTTQGVYAGSITITAADTSVWGTLSFTTTISDTPLTITSNTVTNLGLRIVLNTFTFTDDANSTANVFTANINWGDGTTSRGLVVRDAANPGRFFVLSLHMYRRAGTYNVTSSVLTSEVGANPTTQSVTTSITV
jgi:hypothetical protein